MEEKTDFNSIKSLRKAGIEVDGNSARRIDPEESIKTNFKIVMKVLEKARKIIHNL